MPNYAVYTSTAFTEGSVVATATLGTGTADNTTYLRGDSTWQSVAGGSDPWTIVSLSSDFQTANATRVSILGLSFTPSANTNYMFEALLLTRTKNATVGPRPGISWPTGMTDGVVQVDQTSGATTRIITNGNIVTSVLAAVGGVPSVGASWPAYVWGNVRAGASPSGNVQLILASETAGTSVMAATGSYLRYRTY